MSRLPARAGTCQKSPSQGLSGGRTAALEAAAPPPARPTPKRLEAKADEAAPGQANENPL